VGGPTGSERVNGQAFAKIDVGVSCHNQAKTAKHPAVF
jgi:hypothetical protein